jgi:flavodoxin
MSTRTDPHDVRAAVLFWSRFGTTERVAKAFESGLRQTGMQTVCASTQSFAPESLKDYDLICIGGPTEVFSATKPMKDFLKSTEKVDLGGKFAFAFDTRLESHVSGSAAKYIEHSLDDQGLHLVAHRESAIVTTKKDGGKIVGALLKEGEEKRFEQLGQQVGAKAVEEMTAISSG